MEMPLNIPAVGSRVWTLEGLQNHGPQEGPLVNVPPNIGGRVTHIEKPWYAPTVGRDLYVVEWDIGIVTKHYLDELGHVLCIGPFNTLAEFEVALKTAKTAEVTKGPHGGLREFHTILHVEGRDLVIHAVAGQARMWNYLEPLLQKAGVKVQENRLKSAVRKRRATR